LPVEMPLEYEYLDLCGHARRNRSFSHRTRREPKIAPSSCICIDQPMKSLRLAHMQFNHNGAPSIWDTPFDSLYLIAKATRNWTVVVTTHCIKSRIGRKESFSQLSCHRVTQQLSTASPQRTSPVDQQRPSEHPVSSASLYG
jgi:hypothetical protein